MKARAMGSMEMRMRMKMKENKNSQPRGERVRGWLLEHSERFTKHESVQ